MDNYKYLILGGGMAANAAIRGIREIDPAGPIGMVSLDIDPPYKRPYLSKGLWKNKPFDSVWLPLEGQDVTRHFGRRIVSLNADQLIAKDDQDV